MAKALREWIDTDVKRLKRQSVRQLSEYHFFRDPMRPVYSDRSYFFAPADGVILYQKQVRPDACLVDIKGKQYSLQDAMRDERYEQESLVIGIFMTIYDVHINRIPFSGSLSYAELAPIDSYNYPMIDLEKSVLDDLRVNPQAASYLHNNQRMLNRIYAPDLQQWYYILQIADYDVSAIVPFRLGQNLPYQQNQRFSQIRFGSQADLILPLSPRYDFELIQQQGTHVEAGLDPLVRIIPKADEKSW